MLPNPYIIKSGKQSNGMWKSPQELKYINELKLDTHKQMILASAIIAAVAEYTKREFEIYRSNETNFVISFLDNTIPQIFFVVLKKYKLDGNKLELIQ